MAFTDFFARKKTCDFVANADDRLTKKYQKYREFLKYNRDTLQMLAELEQLYYGSRINLLAVRRQVDDLLGMLGRLVRALDELGDGPYRDLQPACQRVAAELALSFEAGPTCLIGDLVLPLEALRPETMMEAGGKATNLATIARFLKLPIPPGFAITSYAFERFLEENKLAVPIELILSSLKLDDLADLEVQSNIIQESIRKAPVPQFLADKILQTYEELEAKTYKNVRLAMRSSAVGEDTEASFAGQHLTVLNVTRDGLLEAYKAVVASKYSPRAILYRLNFGLNDRETPMCVAGIAMIDAKASGVMYTVDPTNPTSGLLKISAIWGLGEHLVSGEASPDEFFVDKATGRIVQQTIGQKKAMLVNLPGGGTQLVDVPAAEISQPSLSSDQIQTLAAYGKKLEGYFQSPQDVEWAIDQEGRLYILQSRPLGLVQTKAAAVLMVDAKKHPVLLSQGKMASPGIAAGQVVSAGSLLTALPENAILVARTASPDYAALLGQLKGLITDLGSVTSHLASVAREFGVPAIVNAGSATELLKPGQEITLVAELHTVYQGIVPELVEQMRPAKKLLFNSPVHERLRQILDRISPLNLTDPQAADFTPAGCRTVHDIIRYAHEKAMQEMFGLSKIGPQGINVVQLRSNIPLVLHLIDLGGGLRAGLTTCDTVTADDVESIPLKALWRGFSHPGITWRGAIPFDVKNFLTLMAQGAMQSEEKLPGGDSFALVARDYLNLSAKFGYHFANLDTFGSDDPKQNYINLQFAGGVGSFVGRSLRLTFLAEVLYRLGFTLKVTGDLLEASINGLSRPVLAETLDQVGRLLASSRLLDMAITGEADIPPMVDAFFRGDYDFLQQSENIHLPGFYTHTGNWRLAAAEGQTIVVQDGSNYLGRLSAGLAGMMTTMIGKTYLEILDNIGAYFYFPLAIAKESYLEAGSGQVQVRPVSGRIDQAAGLAFGIRNVGNYFVFRVNTLEEDVALFEFVDNKRYKRVSAAASLTPGHWYELRVDFAGRRCLCWLDGKPLLDYTATRPLDGYLGLWTKADAVSHFADLKITRQQEPA
ncbi:MAG: PEP/pyruvate-binding domain-containing protein [Desulfobacca sp.]|uniref:PEP/pyruvate-binding domain-containing protein n=1 Tax=Desulfobacca sp. TaxID=2067990 RepID=UPI00404A9FBE